MGKAWMISGSLYFARDESDDLSVGKSPAPAGEILFFGFIPLLLQFIESQDEIPQGGHGKGAVTPANGRGVLAQTDIPAIMRSVFGGGPMAANALEQLGGGVLRFGSAGTVETVFAGFVDDFALTQGLLLTPHRHKLPTTAQTRLLWAQADSLHSPAV